MHACVYFQYVFDLYEFTDIVYFYVSVFVFSSMLWLSLFDLCFWKVSPVWGSDIFPINHFTPRGNDPMENSSWSDE